MPDDHMHDLMIRPLPGGAIELEQRAGSLDEPAVIHLHPAQVRLVAERAGLGARRLWCLQSIAGRLDELRRLHYVAEIIDRCGSGIEIELHIRAVEDLVDELLTGAPSVTAALPEATPCHDNSAAPAAINVTQPAPKRGRPATGKALSTAQRQARHRAKQGDAPAQADLSLTGNGFDRPTAENQP